MSDFEILPPEDLSVLMPDELIKLCFERWTQFEFRCDKIPSGDFRVDCWAMDTAGRTYQSGVISDGVSLVNAQRALLLEFLAPGVAS